MFMLRKIVRGCGYFVAGPFIGALLFLIGTPAFAQNPIPRGPVQHDRPVARIVVATDTLQLYAADGREKVALTPAGIEFSDTATLDFSPYMLGQRFGDLKALVRVRVNGRVYVLQAFEDLDVAQRGEP